MLYVNNDNIDNIIIIDLLLIVIGLLIIPDPAVCETYNSIELKNWCAKVIFRGSLIFLGFSFL